jgi:hypothetical protein
MWCGTAWCGRLRLLADRGSVGGNRRSGNSWGSRPSVGGSRPAGLGGSAAPAGDPPAPCRRRKRQRRATKEGAVGRGACKRPSASLAWVERDVCRCEDGERPSPPTGDFRGDVCFRHKGKHPSPPPGTVQRDVCRRQGARAAAEPSPLPQPPFFAPQPTPETPETRRGNRPRSAAGPRATNRKRRRGAGASRCSIVGVRRCGVHWTVSSVRPRRRSSHGVGLCGQGGCAAAAGPCGGTQPRRSGRPRGRSEARRRR